MTTAAPTALGAHTNALDEARALPQGTTFTLGTELTNVQRAFMHLNGYLHFRGAATQTEVDTINAEIRVAQGTYRPDFGTGDRLATFLLRDGVVINGGYAGFGETDPK